MECRPGCGACCIAPSISSSIPGMPQGKAAGECCLQLDQDNLCRIFGQRGRPTVCCNFTASKESCGESREEALLALAELEAATAQG